MNVPDVPSGRVVDLTLLLTHGLKTWDIKPPFTCLPAMTAATFTKRFTTKLLVMEDHTGTHVDAPLHFYDGGYRTPVGWSIAQVPLELLMGDAVLIDCSHKATTEPVDAAMLQERATAQGVDVRAGDIVLIRYWPGVWGEPMDEFLTVRGVTLDACEWLRDRGVKAVGVDHPNLEGQVKEEYGNITAPGHEMFLHPDHYVPIIENLVDLGTIRARRFWFAALPLKIAEGTGSPVRAVAVVPSAVSQHGLPAEG